MQRWKSKSFYSQYCMSLFMAHSGTLSVCSIDTLLQARTVCYVPEYPSVPVYLQRNLTEYFVAVDVNNMLQLYASMLHERRIIITSSKLSTVSPFLPPVILSARDSYQLCPVRLTGNIGWKTVKILQPLEG